LRLDDSFWLLVGGNNICDDQIADNKERVAPNID